jgi:acetylornithine/succinyldiaminopimelate/putrescine aminotransferase
MATADAAVRCLLDEGMVENSREMGKLLLDELRKNQSPIMSGIRGRGLFIGLGIKKSDDIKVDGDSLVAHLRSNSILTIKAKAQTTRLMPPLIINRS